MYEEDANKNCTADGCYGNGIIHAYWRNDKEKIVESDWLYCQSCFPNSRGTWKHHPVDEDWVEVDINEFDRLIKEGYKDWTGF